MRLLRHNFSMSGPVQATSVNVLSKAKRLTIILLISVLLIIAISLSANAYTILSRWRYSGGNMTVTYAWGASMPFSSDWKTAFNAAASDWSAAPTNVDYAYYSASGNKLGIVDKPGGSAGYFWGATDAYGYLTSFSAAGNINQAVTGTYTSTMKRSTAGHELGHGLGLGEENLRAALMNQNRNRSTVYKPQQDDTDGVNFLY